MPPKSAGEDSFNATVSSQLTTLLIYPLELAKTRYQASSAKSDVRYNGLVDALQHIVREEGFAGLYNGVQGEMIQQALMQGVFYFFYQYFKSKAAEMKRNHSAETYQVRVKVQMETKSPEKSQQIKVAIETTSEAIENMMVDLSGADDNSLCFDLAVSDSNVDTVKTLFGDDWKRNIETQVSGLQISCVDVDEKAESLNFMETTASGLIAGSITVIIMLPVTSVLTRMQTRSKKAPDSALGLVGTLNYLIEMNGISSLYRGLVPGLILTTNPTILNLCYDKGRAYLVAKRSDKSLSAAEAFFLACLAKFIATVFTYPYIISKTRLMTVDDKTGKPLYRSTAHVIRTIVATEGLFGMYRGIWTQSFKSVLQMGLLLMFKEKVPILRKKLQKFLVAQSL